MQPGPAVPDGPPAVVAPDGHSALRADIRRLATLLGDTLVRQEGQELLDLVEQVRALAREEDGLDAGLLGGLDLATTARLVRAFSTYFHLANVTEQVHRGRGMARRRREQGGWLHRALAAGARAGRAGRGPRCRRRAGSTCGPVLTAHPTEATRRSVLLTLRRDRRPAGRRGRPAHRAAAGRDGRAAVADRRPARHAAVAAGRGAQRRLLPRGLRGGRGRRRAGGAARRAAPRSASSCRSTRGRCRSAPGSAGTATATRT